MFAHINYFSFALNRLTEFLYYFRKNKDDKNVILPCTLQSMGHKYVFQGTRKWSLGTDYLVNV